MSTTTLPNGLQTTPYNATLAASGGTTPYIWAVTSATLPAGPSLNSATGVISGIPTAAGSFTITLDVQDSTTPTPQTVSNPFAITIGGALSITTETFSPAVIAGIYNQTLTATGGTSPYWWTITSGQLPRGVTLNAAGNLTGSPTATGTYPE